MNIGKKFERERKSTMGKSEVGGGPRVRLGQSTAEYIRDLEAQLADLRGEREQDRAAWMNLATLLKTGGMADPAFLYGQVEAELKAAEALRAERDRWQAEAFEKHNAMMAAMAERDAARAERDALQQQLKEARGEGFECPVCGFASNTDHECPNDGATLMLVTWKHRALSIAEKYAALRSRGQVLVQQWEIRASRALGNAALHARGTPAFDLYMAVCEVYKACADALSAALSERGHVDGHADTKETP